MSVLDASIKAAREATIEHEIAKRGIALKRVGLGGEWIGPCPKCGGTDRFSINTKRNIWHCRQCQGDSHGDVIGLVQHLDGCSFEDAVRKLTGEPERLALPKANGNGSAHHGPSLGPAQVSLGPIVETYDYTDEAGTILFQVTRHNPKDFRQRRPDGKGGWISSTDGVRVVPYRLPDLLESIERKKTVWVCEGEADCDHMWAAGYPATTNPRGAGNWQPELDQHFAGANVVVVGDNDPQAVNKKTGQPLFHHDGRPRRPGQDHAVAVAERLKSVAANVTLIDLAKEWPQCPPKGDMSDYLAAGLSPDALLVNSADNTRIFKPLPEHIREMKPPEYLIKGILQRGYVYTLTAAPGDGKTALALLMAMCVSQGLPFGGKQTKQGAVFYFAGENPENVFQRSVAQCQHMGVDENNTGNLWVAKGPHKFSEIADRIRKETAGIEAALVIVDTSIVFFEGDDENSNAQMQEHATRLRETLTSLDGRPTVIIVAHPSKNAGEDNLTPRGGSAFLGAMDGNLFCRKTDSALELHHDPRKFRGAPFDPLSFQVKTVTHERLRSTDGDLVPALICMPISDQAVEEIKTAMEAAEDKVLASVVNDGTMSLTERASRLGWLMSNGEPNKGKVNRCVKNLVKDGLVKLGRGGRPQATKEGFSYAVTLEKSDDER